MRVSLGLDKEAWADLQTVRARFGCDVLTAVKLALKRLSSDASGRAPHFTDDSH